MRLNPCFPVCQELGLVGARVAEFKISTSQVETLPPRRQSTVLRVMCCVDWNVDETPGTFRPRHSLCANFYSRSVAEFRGDDKVSRDQRSEVILPPDPKVLHKRHGEEHERPKVGSPGAETAGIIREVLADIWRRARCKACAGRAERRSCLRHSPAIPRPRLTALLCAPGCTWMRALGASACVLRRSSLRARQGLWRSRSSPRCRGRDSEGGDLAEVLVSRAVARKEDWESFPGLKPRSCWLLFETGGGVRSEGKGWTGVRVGGANVPGLIGLGEMMMTLQNHVRQQPGVAMMLTLQNAMRPGPQQSMFRDSVKLEHSEQYPHSFSPSEAFASTASGGYEATEGELAWCFA
jgi:hypothetical protein